MADLNECVLDQSRPCDNRLTNNIRNSLSVKTYCVGGRGVGKHKPSTSSKGPD